jgi:hypothetical protein
MQFANPVANALGERNRIVNTYMPVMWRRYGLARANILHRGNLLDIEPRVQMQIGMQVLKLCSASRASFVLAGMAHGVDINTAQDMSYDVLGKYLDSLEHTDVPVSDWRGLPEKSLLSENELVPAVNLYEKDVDAYGKTKATYLGTVGLAMRGLVELADACDDGVVWPRPGLSQDNLQRWDFVPDMSPAVRPSQLD